MKVLIPRTVINISIPYTLRERLHELSGEKGATLSGTVAGILTAYFDEQDNKRATPSRRKAAAQKGGR